MHVDVGTTFPTAIRVESPSGPVTISGLLGKGPVVIAFHRMWCPFCQQAARNLVAAREDLERFGARVVIVYRDDVLSVKDSCADRAIPFDCVSDSHRQLEQAADIAKFSLRRYLAFSPAKVTRALRSGSRMGMSAQFLQGRGTFVLDRTGIVVYAHRSTTAADIPPIDDILVAVRAAAHDRTDELPNP